MTDNEIIKALECCTEDEDCSHCPSIKEMPYCSNDIMVGALNLIKRQQEEIEQLKFEIAKLLPKGCPYAIQVEVSNKLEARIKSEAVKEFAERLKERIIEDFLKYNTDATIGYIYNIVKEMVGEKE